MENDREQLAASLRETARAEAAPWTDFPPTPAWYPPGCGAWSAGLVLAVTVLDGLAQLAAAVVLAAVAFAWGRWYRGYRGTMPRGRDVPERFRPAARRFVVLNVLVVLVVALLAPWSPWLGALAALVGITVVFAWYEKAYAEAARLTRADLV